MKPGVLENAKTPYDNLYGCKKILLIKFAKAGSNSCFLLS